MTSTNLSPGKFASIKELHVDPQERSSEGWLIVNCPFNAFDPPTFCQWLWAIDWMDANSGEKPLRLPPSSMLEYDELLAMFKRDERPYDAWRAIRHACRPWLDISAVVTWIQKLIGGK